MAAPINVELRGYLDFFGLKNGGMNPQQPAGFLQPTMDLQRWYLESRVLEVNALAASRVVNAAAQVVNFTSTTPQNLVVGGVIRVPNDEIWVVLPGSRLQWNFFPGAQIFEATWAFTTGSVVNWPPTDLVGFQSSDAATPISGGRVLNQVYWLSPGNFVQYYILRCVVPADSIAVSASLRLVRLRV